MHVFSMYSTWSARFKVTVTYLFYCFNEINCIAKLLLPVTFGWLFKPSAGVSDNERIAFSVAFCWHCPHSMWSRVYVTVRCLSVCLSHSPAAATCGEFAAVGPAWKRYRSIAARPAPQQHAFAARRSAANAGSATFTADVGRWTHT